jgi:hypothetical protein
MQKQCYIGIGIIFLSGLVGFGFCKIRKMKQKKQYIKDIENKDIEHIEDMEESDLKVEM